jgi:O-antigen/teichoic acid export membrane protein
MKRILSAASQSVDRAPEAVATYQVPRTRLVARRLPLPPGALLITAAFVLSGAGAYGFLLVAARALGPAPYASLSAFWMLVFLLSPALLLPLEQEVARALADRRSRGLGGRPILLRAAGAGCVIIAVVMTAATLAARPLVDQMFDGQHLLLPALGVALIGYLVQTLLRGAQAGLGRFDLYALTIGGDGALRLIGGLVMVALQVRTAVPFAMLVGLAPLIAALPLVHITNRLVERGPAGRWSEFSMALGCLVTSSLLAQGLLNAPPLVVKALASPAQRALAGQFLAGVVIARIPLFLFQGIQATLMPNLAGLAGAGRHQDLRRALWRLVGVILLFGIGAVAAATIAGRWALSLFFGRHLEPVVTDLTLLTAASMLYMLALVFAQLCIVLSGYSGVVCAWALGVAAFVVVSVLSTGFPGRVELGYLVGSAVAASAMAVLCLAHLQASRRKPYRNASAAVAHSGEITDHAN